MKIVHIALGGCLTAPDVSYGLTEDTGGHIAYVLGAARAQALRNDVTSVSIVTRAFDDPALGADYARLHQPVQPKLSIARLLTGNTAYLSKDGLADEIPAIRDAFMQTLADPQTRPDIIHAHFADAAVLARAAQETYGIPFIYTPHSLGIDKLAHLGAPAGQSLTNRIAQERAALSAADAIVVSSRDEAERQVSAYGLDVDGKVHRIWPGVDLPAKDVQANAARELVKPYLTDMDRPMILAIARPVTRKNLATLARAYAASPALQAAANLVIMAGQHGPQVTENDETAAVWGDLQAQLNRSELSGRVALPPSHSPGDIASLYTMAQQVRGVFVNVALHEPFGLTLLEAASHGVPVIAGDRGGPPDIIARTGHGQVIDPQQPAAVESVLLDMLTNSDVWDRHAQAAGDNIAAFQWDAWAKSVARVCASVTGRNKAAPASPAYVLGCDIDHTLTGSAEGVAAFLDWHANRRGIFAVATGRSIVEARRVLSEWDLPLPDVFITAVGTEVHIQGGDGRWSLSEGYVDRLEQDWDRHTVERLIRTAGLQWQADIEQRRWKFGCFGDVAEANRLRALLRRAEVSARVIASHGNLIDVIPAKGGKGSALEFVARHYGLTMDQVAAAGDSGNDVDMLQSAGRGIVVGNALPEIAYLRQTPHIYHAKAHHAAGVLEGFRDWNAGHSTPAHRSKVIAKTVPQPERIAS